MSWSAGQKKSQMAAALMLASLALLPAMVGHASAADGLPGRRVTAVRSPLLPLGPRAHAPFPAESQADRQLVAQQVETQRRWVEIHNLLASHHVSHKSQAWLRRQGLGPELLATGAKVAARAEMQPDTLKVLIVRIGFGEDRSGPLTSVTEDGNFTLRPPADEELIDRPPRNRSFYESHLFGLAEYYRLMSSGRLVIRGRVLPEGLDDSYFLSDLADYGPGRDAFWTLESLERLVRDMIAVTDSTTQEDGPVDLSDFDDDDLFTYIIFVHAGSDWQSDINNDSPNDVPTFFVSLGEAEPLRGGGHLSECSVIPETTSQDGLIGSIAGALYHEFGHALGLVDLYDTTTGLPRVGIWSLMDSGTNLVANVGIDNSDPPDGIADDVLPVVGLLPPSLSAWDKWFLGWLESEEIANAETEYRLPAVQVPREDYPRYRNAGMDFRLRYPKALVGGGSAGEFFLVENRWVPLDAGELPDQEVFFVSDQQTGVILYLGGDEDPQTEQPRNTAMYDFFMPESGLLVWHVNMNRIEANLQTNTVNAWGDGLRLVEADGIQDIGLIDAYVLGFFGSYRDPFNEVNGDRLYLEGAPSSRAFDRSWTGLQIADIAGSDQGGRAVMACSASVTPLAVGSPFEVAAIDSAEAAVAGGVAGPRALLPNSATPVVFKLAGDTAVNPALLVADQPGLHWEGGTYPAKLFAWQPDGTPALTQPPGLPAAAAWEFPAPLAGPPVWADLALPMIPVEEEGLVVGLVTGQVWAFDDALDPTGALALRWGPVALGDSLAFAPVPAPAGGGFLCCLPPDSLRFVTGDGSVGDALVLTDTGGGSFGSFTAPPAPLGLTGGRSSWAVFGATGWYLVTSDQSGQLAVPDFQPYLQQPPAGTIRRAVVRDGESAALVVFDGQGALGSWQLDSGGLPVLFNWSGPTSAVPVAEPAVADLDGNGHDDLILLTESLVYACQASGVALTGYPVALAELFPLPDSTCIAGPAVVCDATGDGANELYFTTNQGHLVALDSRGYLQRQTPYLWAKADSYALAVGPALTADERILWLVAAAGRKGPPLDRRELNGRIAGYRLPGSGTALQGTSEWLGTGGSSARLGPAGTAAPLDAPAAWRQDIDSLVLYPNPLHDDDLNVRFYSHGGHDARLVIYNLEGEIVVEQTISVVAGQINEHRVPLVSLASGLYICQLERETTVGLQRDQTSLAIER